MKVLIICGIFAEENQSEIIKNTKGYVEFSANIFQKKIIKGFKQNNIDIEVVSAPLIPSYPNKYNRMFFRGFKSKENDYKYVNFCNVWGFRNFSRAFSLKKAVKDIILSKNNKFDLILVYSAHEPFLEAAVYVKKLLPNSKICFIVPDLPQYMNLNSSKTKIYDFLKKIDIKRINKLIDNVDSFVILTEPMKEALNIGDRPYMVTEGIIDDIPSREIFNEKKYSEIKSIVYTGKLNIQFGIKDLIDSFMRINNENIRLILCGDGDARNYVIEKAADDSRILYKGQVSTKEAEEIISKATVLVNPRPNVGEYTKYSFPSKTIEYIMSGNPVVAYMLDGMPKIYSQFVFPIEPDKSLQSALENALNSDNRQMYHNFCDYAEKQLSAKGIVKRIMSL